jgi:hypothetical protein
MGVAPLSLRHRRVLRLLADAPDGRADGKLIARFTTEIFELIVAGLVEVQVETGREEGGRKLETVYVRISAAGRRAIEE